MYTVQQLQAADYLLKRLLKLETFPFKSSDLKFVIDLNGSYWHGDFVNFINGVPAQYFIENLGDVDYTYFYFDGNNATAIFKKMMDTYAILTKRHDFYTNPFLRINSLDLLFNTIFKLVNQAEIQPEDSPIYPYLLNAKSLDGKLELPFINLENQEIKVVSLINLTDATS